MQCLIHIETWILFTAYIKSLILLIKVRCPIHIVLLLLCKVFGAQLQCLLQSKHLVADIIAHLYRHRVLHFEFFAASILQYGLALLVRALILATPLFMLVNQWEKNEFTTRLTVDLEYVDELLEDVAAWTHSQDAWTLEWTVFLPALNACFAEEFAAIVTFHRLT